MSALTVTLGADITALKKGMAAATALVAASARRMASITGAGLAGIGRGGAAVLEKGFSVAGTAIKASIVSALAGGVTAAGAGVKAVSAAADFEQTQVAFTTLIGDAAKAQETLSKLRELGAKTPFEFPELADAGRKLIAFGEGADTVPETLRRIGDVSAGVQAPVNEIAELYGKARVQGRLFAEDVNQLTGRGIPIIGQLAKQFGVSDSEVKKLVETGQVGFPQIEQAFIAMTSEGGQFAGMMEAQSRTTTGLFSTLKDTINEVFLTLGQPINDALRPLVGEAIGLVQTLTPMAVEAGKRVKDAILFVIAAFKSGQVLDLVTSALKLGFANGVNALINGFRMAIEFFWNLITDGAMWKSLGIVLLGVAAGFGAALLNAFQTPIVYLQAGMEWIMANLLKGLLQIPGISSLMGFDSEDVEADFDRILKSREAQGAEFFGLNFKDMAAEADAMMNAGAPALAERVAEAARKAGASAGSDLIDTSGLRASFGKVVDSITESMPKPEEAAQALKAAGKTDAKTAATGTLAAASSRLDPIVTSLGKVGGGGYSSGTLDAQRENNRLTGETNRLLGELGRKVERLSGGGLAAFG
ncbi:MAG: tape measure protein [Verrucomicrobiales bacterium]|nr:tape measure protein [Verrucomicrobiales bacterium]